MRLTFRLAAAGDRNQSPCRNRCDKAAMRDHVDGKKPRSIETWLTGVETLVLFLQAAVRARANLPMHHFRFVVLIGYQVRFRRIGSGFRGTRSLGIAHRRQLEEGAKCHPQRSRDTKPRKTAAKRIILINFT